jgi:hypothetical protein
MTDGTIAGEQTVTASRLAPLPLLAVLALLVAACQGGGGSPSTSSGAIESTPASHADAPSTGPSAGASADGEETSVLDLEVGDCFTADVAVLESALVVGCEHPHVYEVFHVYDHQAADDAFPGEDALEAAAAVECEAAFEGYVGIGYQDSRWYGTTVPPSEDTWALGDREVLCLLHLQDESEVTGSARDSGE